ncbi:MAG TPA: CcdB family protein [Rhodopila sp.]|uniref:CcdB family protein n=1 Tax=Rhodopila sp. TaxID=2480087 RepID=UPI002B85F837|nr:CcdB family protein [Rhodopila sp.]HVY17236.1 CcdB family protein [Rhodopila sp.]
MTPAAQFSVHRSPTRSAARPLVLILQANDFARMPTRLVAPLIRPDALPQLGRDHPRIAPLLTVQGEGYVLNPFDLATLGVSRLGEFITSFADDEDAKRRIQDALDAVLKPY